VVQLLLAARQQKHLRLNNFGVSGHHTELLSDNSTNTSARTISIISGGKTVQEAAAASKAARRVFAHQHTPNCIILLLSAGIWKAFSLQQQDNHQRHHSQQQPAGWQRQYSLKDVGPHQQRQEPVGVSRKHKMPLGIPSL
jgi:hypothetical protein